MDVPESNTVCTTKQAALQVVGQMSRPEGMTRVTWASVHLVLEVIAQSYPKAFPSQVRLAERTGIPVRSIQRYIALAVAAELLVVEADTGAPGKRHNPSRTNRYHVKLAPSDAANLARDKNTTSYGGGSVTPSPETSSLVPSSCSPSGLAPPPPSEPHGSTVVSMRDWDDERSRNVGTPAAPPLRSKHRARPVASDIIGDIDSRRRRKKRPPKQPDRWDRLVDYFGVVWEQMVLDNPRYRPIRPVESRGQVKTYLRAHFQDRTELEVRKMMEEFVIAVSKRRITVKPGQSAWMKFTGAWGRQRHVVAEDRYAAYTEG